MIPDLHALAEEAEREWLADIARAVDRPTVAEVCERALAKLQEEHEAVLRSHQGKRPPKYPRLPHWPSAPARFAGSPTGLSRNGSDFAPRLAGIPFTMKSAPWISWRKG